MGLFRHGSELMENKLDKIIEKIASIDVTLAKQSVILEEHVKRTNLLEEKIEPIEKHVAMVNGALKLLGLIAIIVAIIEGTYRIMGGP